MTNCWSQDSKCHKAHIEKDGYVVNWFRYVLDHNPNDEYWKNRDYPYDYKYWTDEYEAVVKYSDNELITIEVRGRDAANDLWRFLKHASLEEIEARYKKVS